MTADLMLSRLHNVRATGPASWRADCPNGHQHARGSLAITVADDGRLLVYDFAGCDVGSILAAVGLELADLYPERVPDATPEGRKRAREAFRRTAWAAAVGVLSREGAVVLAAAEALRRGKPLSADDNARLLLAMQRIENARVVLA